MKTSAVIVSAFAAVAAAVQPHILNTSFDLKQGEPFTLEFDGCPSGCTVELKTGPKGALTTYKTLSPDATGGTLIVTLTGVPSGEYAFEIIDNSTKELNYSVQFQYEGTGAASTTGASSTSATSTTATTATSTSTTSTSTTSTTSSTTSTTSTTTSSASKTKTKTKTSLVTSTTSIVSTPTSTEASSTEASSTSTSTAVPSSPPNSGVDRLASPLALVAGVLAAMAYLN